MNTEVSSDIDSMEGKKEASELGATFPNKWEWEIMKLLSDYDEEVCR